MNENELQAISNTHNEDHLLELEAELANEFQITQDLESQLNILQQPHKKALTPAMTKLAVFSQLGIEFTGGNSGLATGRKWYILFNLV